MKIERYIQSSIKLRPILYSAVCAFTLTSSPGIAHEEPEETQSSKVDCDSLSNDAAWVAYCEASLAMDAAAKIRQDATGEKAEAEPPSDGFAELVFKKSSWLDPKMFDRLSEAEIYPVYNHFVFVAGNRGFSEWACDTGRLPFVNSEVKIWADRIFISRVQELAVQDHRLSLELSGVGNRYSKTCDFKELADTRTEYSKSTAMLESLFRLRIR